MSWAMSGSETQSPRATRLRPSQGHASPTRTGPVVDACDRCKPTQPGSAAPSRAVTVVPSRHHPVKISEANPSKVAKLKAELLSTNPRSSAWMFKQLTSRKSL
jgi:hypothetical protein